MWSKRSLKNRRLEREFVLDVKLRSSQVRAARARMAAITLGSLFASIAALYLGWRAGEWTLNALLYENKAFAIQEIDVQTDGTIALDQIRRWTGVCPGQNVFALDLAAVRRNLELVSMIQTVSLEKILPRTLRIRVIEREPLAQFNIARPRSTGGIELVPFYLDADAYVISPLSSAQCSASSVNQPNDQLPVIVGLNANEVQPGRRIESTQARAALQLIQAFERSPMQALVDLSRIDLSMSDVLIVKTGQGSEITFGLTDIDQQLLRWQAAFGAGQGMNKSIATLDLAVSNNIPATWLEASALSPPSAKLPKSLRNRKKHV
jgi:POTRA domain-containing FtsQ-type protein